MNVFSLISLLFNAVLLYALINFYLKDKFFVIGKQQKKTAAEEEHECSDSGSVKDNNNQIDEFKNEKLLSELKEIIETHSEQTGDSNIPAEKILQKTAASFNAVQGAFYILYHKDQLPVFRFVAGYAFYLPDSRPIEYESGEGLIGQVAKDKNILNLHSAPFEHAPVFSGLGKAVPKHLIICPLVKKNNTVGVIELAAFAPFTGAQEITLKSIADFLADKINYCHSGTPEAVFAG